MAEYHLHAKTHSRGAGKGAGGHVRYILREGTYAQKTVEQVNGAVIERVRIDRSSEVLYAESGHLPAWARTPADYWDAADQHERANGTVYREIEFALPKELSDNENIELARSFAEELAAVPGGTTPYTLAIHRSEKKPMLLHCHLMLSDKVNDGIERDPALWFRRAANPGKDPARGGAPKTQARIGQGWLGDVVRPLWERLANDALAHAEVDARIDHRSLETRRMEQEALAAQAMRDHHEIAALQHTRSAEALDRPPEPKKGRVLTHAGPEKAPGRAAMVVDFEAAKAARWRAVEARRLAEAELARDRQAVEQAQAVLSAARARQALRDPFDKMRTRERWRKRRQARVDRVLDTEALAETRNGFRAAASVPGNPERPAWAVYRERVLTEAYGADVGQALGRWVRVERDRGSRTLGRAPSLHIHNQVMDITDYGDRLVALQAASSPGGKAQEIAAMLKIAGAKGWKALTVTGTEDFQMRAGAAALAAGFTLADGDLAARIAAQQEKDAEAQRAKDLEVAPVLAEWMRAHPKQAQAQRLAGGKLPLACPAGLDRAALQRPALWDAAEAWTEGRYGEKAAWQALSKDPDPLKAQAAAAGREAAYNAWAQGGLTLKVGKDAPEGPGIAWTLSGAVTRESVERYAGFLQDRRKRAGVDHKVTVTFGGDVSIMEKVLVLEHLLRQSVPLDAPALEKAGDRYALDQARERLNTHEPDGQQQFWYTLDLEQKAAQRKREEAARIRADRVKKLDALASHLERHGSGNSGKHFQEAGFVVNEKGKYVYPDPDMPGVRAAWDALATAKRKEMEADLQNRAESVGHRAESGLWSPEQRNADPEHQRLVQEIQDDTSLKEMANTAYKQGRARARQEREAQLEQDRKVLRAAAHKLGRRAEKVGCNAGKQAEIQREFVELVQRGAGLGVDGKALSKSLQGGREAYRQEQKKALSNSKGIGW
ncbi:MAG: MobA/MobL family protein [Acidithiobacillus sp.]|nr:MobA/MobL family protein [Acidithiobacillus sp.]